MDIAIDKLHERRKAVRERLHQQYKRTKFRQEPMSNEEALYYYNQITPEQMNSYIQTYGRDAVNDMIFKFETLKRKREVR